MFSVICATRNRLENMKRLYETCQGTSTEPIEFVWYIDEDDTKSVELAQKLNTKYMTLPRYSMPLSQTANECFKLCTGEIIFGAGDDLIFDTEGWNEIVRKAYDKYPDKILLCGGYDGLNRELLTHPFIHRNWVNTVGRLFPPYFRDCYVDTWLNEVAQTIGRIEWLPIYIEHLHFSVGKSPYDNTAKERMSHIQSGDESGQIFMRTKLERLEEAKRLNNFIKEYDAGR